MKDFTKKLLSWGAFNIVFYAFVIAGTVFTIAWAGNVAIFLVWLSLFCSIGAYNMEGETLETVKERYACCPKWYHTMGFFSDIILACILVASGWWVTAVALMISASFENATKMKMDVKI